jgi:multicomponent Na+:H+ antiporter subunit G
MREAIAAALLFAGVACALLGALGVLLMRDALDRLHYVGLGAPAALLIGAAVVVKDSFSLIGGRAIVVGVLVLVTSPVLTHTTARIVHSRSRG